MKQTREISRVPRLLLVITGSFALLSGCGESPQASSGHTADGIGEHAGRWPATPAGNLAATLIELVERGHSEGDTTPLAAFYGSNASDQMRRELPTPEQVEWLVQLRRDTGSLQLWSVIESRQGAVVVLLRAAETGSWIRFTLFEHRGRITGYLFEPAEPPNSLDVREDATSVEQILENAREASGVPALAAAVFRDGDLVGSAATGIQEVGTARSVSVDDAFHIGSITKSMTAAVIGSLVESGVLRFDATVADLNPGLQADPVYATVTLAELLQHAAGLPAMTGPEIALDESLAGITGSPVEQRARFAEILVRDPSWASERGAFEYSNAGYGLAAHLAEHVTGKSWAQLVEEVVFVPAGMTSAGIGWPATESTPERVRGHLRVDGAYQTIPFGEYRLEAHIAPAGDVHCSVVDLARWGNVQLAGFQGDPPTLSMEMISTLHRAEYDPGYAYGWSLRQDESGTLIWHNGSAGTFYAQLQIDKRSSTVVAVVSNAGISSRETVEGVARSIQRLVTE